MFFSSVLRSVNLQVLPPHELPNSAVGRALPEEGRGVPALSLGLLLPELAYPPFPQDRAGRLFARLLKLFRAPTTLPLLM